MADPMDFGWNLAWSALYTAITVGLTLAAFWILNLTPMFEIDIQLFLDQFAVPYFLSFYVIRLGSGFIGELEGMM